MNKISSYLIRKKPNLFFFFFSIWKEWYSFGAGCRKGDANLSFLTFLKPSNSYVELRTRVCLFLLGVERDGKCLNSWWGFCVCVFWGMVGGLRNHCGNVTLSTGITEIVLQVGFMSKSIRPSKHKHTRVSHACTEVNDQPEISLPSSFCCKD